MNHLELAAQLIERMKQCHPTCDACSTLPFSAGAGGVTPAGYEMAHDFAGFLKRCEHCAVAPKFPRAAELNVDRVACMLVTDARCRSVFALEILQETL